jgi:hypothetical protein
MCVMWLKMSYLFMHHEYRQVVGIWCNLVEVPILNRSLSDDSVLGCDAASGLIES